jgi:hypothetical protein
MKDITPELNALMARGYRFIHPRDSGGEIVAVVGVRAHHGVVDLVQLYGEQDADAARIPGDEPDIFFPKTVLWRTTGNASEVIKQALELEDPIITVSDDIRCRTNDKGCWVPTHAARATWLPASA